MHQRSRFWLTAAALLAAVVAVTADQADAKQRRPKGRKAHKFLSAKAPAKGRTPATNSDGAPSASPRDVSGGAFEGAGRQDVLTGGAALLLSPTRALVANPYRGLSIVDVTDPDAPTVLGSVTLPGSADRVFVDGSTALVVSRRYGESGGATDITSVDLSDESAPAVGGTATVEGDLAGVVQSGGDLIVVTTTFGYGPWLAMDAGGAVMKGAANEPTGGMVTPDFWYPWGEATVRTARVTRGNDGTPTVVGTYAADGWLVGHDVGGDRVALVLDQSQWNTTPGGVRNAFVGNDPSGGELPGGGNGIPSGNGYTSGLVLLDVDASGAPALIGSAPISDLYGVSSLDVAEDVARFVGWGWDGGVHLATYGLGDGAPDPLATFELGGWPSASAFVGDRLVIAEAGQYVGEDLPGAPDDSGKPGDDPAEGTNGGMRGAGPAIPVQLPSKVTSIDLSDPSNPASLGSVEVTDGWVSSMHVAGDDVVVAIGDYAVGTTHLFRIDLAGVPAVEASEDVEGSFWTASSTGDLLLLTGGALTADGGYVPQIVPVSTAANGLDAGGAIETTSWVAASAWSDPILGLASVDSLELFDLSDFARPAARGTVRLAVNVSDLAIVGDSAAACLVTDYVGGAIEVRTVGLPSADVLQPLDVATLGTGDARLFHDGPMLYVVSTDWRDGSGAVTVVDASDPSDLRVRGTLDLASYPGQAFLVDGALVLLREATSLVYEDEQTGRLRSRKDGFGRAATGWIRDEQNAVIDVVDLSDPDAPRAAVRKRIRWDWGGEAVLRGTTLYIPSYVTVANGLDGYERYAYGVRGVELADPLRPRIHGLVWVPGSLAAAADEAGRVLTVSYDYDTADSTFAATINLVDLDSASWRGRVVASHVLGGTAGAVVTGEDHVYVATESWNAADSTVAYALETLALADLAPASKQDREQAAWGGVVAGGHLFLRTWGWTGAIDAYSLADPATPSFAASADVDGIGTDIGVSGGRAYAPAGYRGVLGFDL